MSRNRYVGDYRLVESIDGRGRIRTDYEYIGAIYTYTGGAKDARRLLKRALAACAAGAAAYAGALIPVSAAMRTLWVALPFVFEALPLGLTVAALVRALRAGDRLEHRHADQLANRCPACSFFTALLAGIALAGEGVNLIRGVGMLPGDIAFGACAALLLAVGLHNHRLWKRVKCEKTPPPADAGTSP